MDVVTIPGSHWSNTISLSNDNVEFYLHLASENPQYIYLLYLICNCVYICSDLQIYIALILNYQDLIQGRRGWDS